MYIDQFKHAIMLSCSTRTTLLLYYNTVITHIIVQNLDHIHSLNTKHHNKVVDAKN